MIKSWFRKLFLGLTVNELSSIDPQIVAILNKQSKYQLKLIRKLIWLIEE